MPSTTTKKTIRLSERYEPLPTQRRAHKSTVMAKAYVGGWGSGKSMWICQEALRWAIRRPGTEILLGRQYATELEDTTMRLFFERVLPEPLIHTFKKQNRRVILRPMGPNRRKTHIIFRQLEDYYKIKSMELGFVGIDEADEVSEAAFIWLTSRLRHPLGPNKIALASNDEGRNWIYHLFHPAGNKHVPGKYELFVAPTRENFHLPPGTLEAYYKGLPQELIDKYLEPKFRLIGGAVYPEFDASVHVIDPFPIPNDWPIYRVLDPGLTAPTCCLLYTVDEKGTTYIFDEYYENDVTIDEAAGEIKRMSEPFEDRIDYTLIDPSAFKKTREKYGRLWSIAEEYGEQGIFCIMGNNDQRAGIMKVKMALKNRKLFVFRNCENTIDEFPDYEWKRNRLSLGFDESRKDKPRDVRDHAMDCVRYLVSDQSEGPIKELAHQEWWRPAEPEPDPWLLGIPGAR